MEKFYGQFDPPVDKFIFERYFPNKSTKGVFVECGAFDGLTENSCKFFEESMGWKGYNIEPVPWVFEKLCKNRPSSINLNFALSNKSGEAIFKAVDHPTFGTDCTNGSLNHTDVHSALLQEMGCKIVEVGVKLRTWREFINQEKINYIDLLVLDVEGHELSVIDGMEECGVLPDVICIEVGHLDFNKIRCALEKLGYSYDVSSHVNAFFIKKEMIPLFGLRKIDYLSAQISSVLVIVQDHGLKNESRNPSKSSSILDELKNENNALLEQVSNLQRLHLEISKSKGWQIIAFIRKIRATLRI